MIIRSSWNDMLLTFTRYHHFIWLSDRKEKPCNGCIYCCQKLQYLIKLGLRYQDIFSDLASLNYSSNYIWDKGNSSFIQNAIYKFKWVVSDYVVKK